MQPEIHALLERSHRLGADRRITNHGGGNTSAKLVCEDPVTGEPTAVLAVKGSGGDLATLSESGLALLALDRVRALEHRLAEIPEDELVPLYEHCRFGPDGAVPSIDTPLHALVDGAHVDHLHPDTVIALATAAGSRDLVAECYGEQVGWLAWRRPGFELAVALRDLQAQRPEIVGAVLEGHGLICWADTSEACESTSRSLVARADEFLNARGAAEPFGAIDTTRTPLPDEARRVEAARLAPIVRGLASTDRPVVAQLTDSPLVLDFLARESMERLAALGTSCPDHFLRTKVRPLVLDAASDAPFDVKVRRLGELHTEYREAYRAYYERYADPGSPPMRSSDPTIVLVPGVGMWSFGDDVQTARVAGEFYVNAINVMRGAEAVAEYAPIPEREAFRIEYWELEERKLRLKPPPPPLHGRIALVTGAGSGIGLAIAHSLTDAGACTVVADIDPERAEKAAADLGVDRSLAVAVDVRDEASVEAAFAAAALRFGGVDIVVNNAGLADSAPLADTTAESWDRLHDVLARGSFLVSRAAARLMRAASMPGDIVYVVSKNAVVAGPDNLAYGAAKADQAHQVRLLAAELGPEGIRVNGVNPDAVIRGSGIFTGDWLEQRAAAHGVAPDDLGDFYAARTLLGLEVLPEHVARAVLMLVDGTLARTTGTIIPVDGGVAGAFLR